MNSPRESLSDLAFVVAHVLCVGVALPVLSAFRLTLSPFGLEPRWMHVPAPSTNLGFPWNAEAIPPAQRQADGFTDMLVLMLWLGAIVLVAGCLTLVTLIVRREWQRRSELSVRLAVGATRADIRSEVLGAWVRPLVTGSVLGLALGLGLDAWLRSMAPASMIAAPTRFSALTPLALAAPVLAAFSAANMEANRALTRLREPLSWNPASRLAQLGLGAMHLAALLTLATTATVLMQSSTEVGANDATWAEAADTLVVELAAAPGSELLEEVRSRPDWHLVSHGALEDLGMAEEMLFECNCVMDQLPYPVATALFQAHSVSPGVFEALGIDVRGREFTDADGPGAARVALIDRGLEVRARRELIGQQIRVGPRERGTNGTWYTIVGVVDGTPSTGLATHTEPIPGVYLSSLQHAPDGAQLLVESGGDPEAARAQLASVLPGIEWPSVRTLSARISDAHAPFLWFSRLAVLIGLIIGLIGTLGLATAVALEVRDRSHELGVHRALGAARLHVVRLVASDLGRVTGWGAVLTLIFAPAMVRGLAYRYAAVDVMPWGTVALLGALFVGVMCVGAAFPLWRATRVTPIEAMADE